MDKRVRKGNYQSENGSFPALNSVISCLQSRTTAWRPLTRREVRALFTVRRSAPDLSAYLFGNILTITFGDIALLAGLAVILAIFFILYLRPIIYVAFDREFARSQGIPVQIFEYVLMMFIALTIVACLRMVGIVLVISLLTIPQMTANLFTHRFHRIIWLSIGIGYLSCLGGLMISYYLNVPSGAAIIFFSIIIYVVCKLGKSFYLSLRQKTQNP